MSNTPTLPDFMTPEYLAKLNGWSPRHVRKLARALGACRVMGNRMVLLSADVAVIMRAAKPGTTPDDIRDWLGADTAQMLEELNAQDGAPPAGCVYFVRLDDNVKIGFTTDLKQRLAKIKTAMASEPEVLLTIAGSPALESYLHRKFASDRLRREWFQFSEQIQEYIARRQWKSLPKKIAP